MKSWEKDIVVRCFWLFNNHYSKPIDQTVDQWPEQQNGFEFWGIDLLSINSLIQVAMLMVDVIEDNLTSF